MRERKEYFLRSDRHLKLRANPRSQTDATLHGLARFLRRAYLASFQVAPCRG